MIGRGNWHCLLEPIEILFFCNPMADGLSAQLDSAQLPKLCVVIGGHDLLRDKEIEYCEALKKFEKQIKVVEFEEEDHGFYTLKLDGESSQKLLDCVSHFIKFDIPFH